MQERNTSVEERHKIEDAQQRALVERMLTEKVPGTRITRKGYYNAIAFYLNDFEFKTKLRFLQTAARSLSPIQYDLIELRLITIIRERNPTTTYTETPKDLANNLEILEKGVFKFQLLLNQHVEFSELAPLISYIKENFPLPDIDDPKIPELIREVVQQVRGIGIDDTTLEKFYTSLTSEESFTSWLTTDELTLLKPQLIEKIQLSLNQLQERLEA